MASERDPRKDPRVGDVVVAVMKSYIPGDGPAPVTVFAVTGELVASGSHFGDIEWEHREEWCAESAHVKQWKVLHAAKD